MEIIWDLMVIMGSFKKGLVVISWGILPDILKGSTQVCQTRGKSDPAGFFLSLVKNLIIKGIFHP